ncbi:phosphoribosyltransferase [Nocardiopsis sp. EMB25]|uniref:phosphoribosyltransferase n=1 Tax=Nocardiopsis sp. EMB25 TaxID=2835867 RepID=UPI002284B2F5|nr:phosphoribosyltransferase [Nocardiopsis sp. EMB25]MCY9786274.1 phosphoribosyltransferase [Nocardiopsis sp. EMB25]
MVPITYRNGSTGQHSQALRMYKQSPESRPARTNLAALFADFCLNHIVCVRAAAEVDRFTHVAFVPSTKNSRQTTHPLEETLASTVRSLRRIPLAVNPDVPSDSRDFNEDWFCLDGIPDPSSPTDVLLIDDTWVTGARAQSAAYRLKRAGARRVVTVVLARQIQPTFQHAKPLLERITSVPYDPDTCAFHARAETDLPETGAG